MRNKASICPKDAFSYERVPLQEALNDGCDGIEFGDSVLLIEKT